MVDGLTYRFDQYISDVSIECDPQNSCVKYQISKTENEISGTEMDITALVYEHALLQNVEFEWGTWARPVKTRPQVCGRDLKPF